MADEKKFSFMEEEVMDSKRPKRQFVIGLKKAAINGFIFGMMATFGFCGGYYLFANVIQKDIGVENIEEHVELETSKKPMTSGDKKENQKTDKSEFAVPMVGFNSMQGFYGQVGKLSKQCKRSIVGVTNYNKKAKNDIFLSNQKSAGTIVAQTSKSVFILTSYDAVKNQDGISVTFLDEKVVDGSLNGYDQRLNLAVVKVPKKHIEDSTISKLQVMTMSASNLLDVGDMVFAFGCPNGNLYSAEYGYITGASNPKNVVDYQMDVFTTSMVYHNKANGIICNANGELLGVIDVQGDSTENCTFYGISKLQMIIENLINNTQQIYAGVTARDIPEDILSSHSIRGGVYVESVEDNSPAYDAGIHVGDVIYAIDGENVNTVVDYFKALQRYGVGAEVEFTVIVDPFNEGKNRKVKVELLDRK